MTQYKSRKCPEKNNVVGLNSDCSAKFVRLQSFTRELARLRMTPFEKFTSRSKFREESRGSPPRKSPRGVPFFGRANNMTSRQRGGARLYIRTPRDFIPREVPYRLDKFMAHGSEFNRHCKEKKNEAVH